MKKFICLLFALLMATQLTACASEATKALQEAKRAFNNAEWAEAKDYAQQVINNYPDTKAAQSKLRISKCWVSGPDSAGGYELHINYTNKSDKTIKYFDFGVTFYNAVGDPISTWRIDRTEYCRDTGPIAPGGGQSDSSVYWGKYYDAPIDHPEIVSVDVEYMDGTTWTLTKDEIAYVQY